MSIIYSSLRVVVVVSFLSRRRLIISRNSRLEVGKKQKQKQSSDHEPNERLNECRVARGGGALNSRSVRFGPGLVARQQLPPSTRPTEPADR